MILNSSCWCNDIACANRRKRSLVQQKLCAQRILAKNAFRALRAFKGILVKKIMLLGFPSLDFRPHHQPPLCAPFSRPGFTAILLVCVFLSPVTHPPSPSLLVISFPSNNPHPPPYFEDLQTLPDFRQTLAHQLHVVFAHQLHVTLAHHLHVTLAHQLSNRPLLTNCITYGLLYSGSELIQQTLMKKVNSDWRAAVFHVGTWRFWQIHLRNSTLGGFSGVVYFRENKEHSCIQQNWVRQRDVLFLSSYLSFSHGWLWYFCSRYWVVGTFQFPVILFFWYRWLDSRWNHFMDLKRLSQIVGRLKDFNFSDLSAQQLKRLQKSWPSTSK